MQNIGIIGGDLRIVKLAELYSEETVVYTFGLDTAEFTKPNIVKVQNLKDVPDIIISAIPFSKDGLTINSTYSNFELNINSIFNKLRNKTVIAGAITEDIIKEANSKNIKLIDILENEELAILNAIPTAEGAIQIAMEETRFTIHGSKVLVLGYGRIGKVLSKMLKGIGAEVYCEARKQEDISWIKVNGYKPINFENLDNYLEQFKIIFNTIPSMVLNEERLNKISKDCLIIDLASSPGGIDFNYAKKINIKAILALGLPGKVAPYTAAKFIKDTINNILKGDYK